MLTCPCSAASWTPGLPWAQRTSGPSASPEQCALNLPLGVEALNHPDFRDCYQKAALASPSHKCSFDDDASLCFAQGLQRCFGNHDVVRSRVLGEGGLTLLVGKGRAC